MAVSLYNNNLIDAVTHYKSEVCFLSKFLALLCANKVQIKVDTFSKDESNQKLNAPLLICT